MEIKVLVENTNKENFIKAHGLSFYIKTNKHQILFDVGPDATFIKNAKLFNLDLSLIDIVIISHGHYDHCGGLNDFLKINSKAKIYMQEKALGAFYSKADDIFHFIGNDIKINKQFILLNGNYQIDDELSLYVSNKNILPSSANNMLYDNEYKKDPFKHEQSLVIKENKNVLFSGCAHSGIFSILESINEDINLAIGGFHLFNNRTGKSVSYPYLNKFYLKLKEYPLTFYTCHCTGVKCFNYLTKRLDNIYYLSSGDNLNL